MTHIHNKISFSKLFDIKFSCLFRVELPKYNNLKGNSCHSASSKNHNINVWNIYYFPNLLTYEEKTRKNYHWLVCDALCISKFCKSGDVAYTTLTADCDIL